MLRKNGLLQEGFVVMGSCFPKTECTCIARTVITSFGAKSRFLKD